MAAAFVALTPGTEFYIRNIWPALSPRIRILHNKHIHTYVGLPHWLCVDIDPYRTLHNYTHPYICWCATLAVFGNSSEEQCCRRCCRHNPRFGTLYNTHIHTYVGLPHWSCVDIDPKKHLAGAFVAITLGSGFVIKHTSTHTLACRIGRVWT